MTDEPKDDVADETAEAMPRTEHHLTTKTPQSFVSLLLEQQQGQLVNELSVATRDLIETMENHFAQFRGTVNGEIALKLKFTLNNGQYDVVAEYTTKTPKAPPAKTPMWLGRGGDLITQNPRQIAMPFMHSPHHS